MTKTCFITEKVAKLLGGVFPESLYLANIFDKFEDIDSWKLWLILDGLTVSPYQYFSLFDMNM